MAEELEQIEDVEAEEIPAEENPPVKVDGAFSAAVLMMLLEEQDAAAIMKYLDPEEIRELGKAMFASTDAGEAQIDGALKKFVSQSQSISDLASGFEPHIRNVMHEALGNVRADNILAEIAPKSSAAALDMLRWMDLVQIGRILKNEHPQVGAIILSVLTPEAAAELLEDFSDEDQADLVLRAARLETVSAEAIADLEAIVARAAESASSVPKLPMGGKAEAAKIMNSMPKPSMERLLKTLRKKNKQLGMAIEEEMFIFDNLRELDNKALGTVLRSVEADILALALKGAEEDLADRMLGSMSARAADTIRDQMEESGPVKRSDVEEAQKAIIAIARKLADSGEIMMGSGGDDYV